jgi:hypothetical protein
MILNALQIKILLAILAVLIVIAAVEVRRNRPIQLDPATANKLSHAATPTKPYTVP